MATSSKAGTQGSLTNDDLAPVPLEKRTWTTWDIAALWVGMAVCIPTYTMASNLIGGGMNWWQALLAVLLGNVIVLIPMVLNAHPGTAYGIPFPVLLRASFGIYGANVAALLRGIVACGWFGIQTWFGGAAIYSTAALIFGFDPAAKTPIAGLGISSGQFLCFLIFWAINVYFILKGMNSIKWLEKLSAPFLLLIGLVMLGWALSAADGFGPILVQPSSFATNAEAWTAFGAGLTAMVGFWATLSLNIPDFSRYAVSQKAQIVGQAIALPTTMAFYSFIGIVVTSATVIVFGKAIWDPVELISMFGSPLISIIALLALSIATLSTNIAANVVSPANDFSNLAPRHISFKMGGMITAVIGILMMPWKLVADPSGYIFTWLIGYSALLGPIGGIMIADYYIHRRKKLDVAALYYTHGIYRYQSGYSIVSLATFALAVLPNIPGFLMQIGVLDKSNFFAGLYNYAWFIGFGIAFFAYLTLRRFFPNK
ncbi:NCS1 family nucleobase:cation symporter-1 [Phragmitibacter flavus]|uniref:NCS1 family nucleobase:cation symporter-1 n=1 Tax=Phragmitibacter flavus TaxID=2576071 RepID=A0A5R8K7S0_9BACT|nr:NCS1 family nucleobase:cation symporter-1 [Phragmitibacter flavus]TLD68381.1 NCS1 family nucleobase:cation symporter-1 [Phragmitibacter flavus]